MDRAKFDPQKNGVCLAVFYLVPSGKVRDMIPPHVEIVEIVPGMTLGGIYAARFPQAGSDALNEFGVMPAYVRYESRKGYFLHNFSTDGPGPAGHCVTPGTGQAGTDFRWEFTKRDVSLDVYSGGSELVHIRMTPLLRRLPFSSCFQFLCVKGTNVMFFKNRLASSIGVATTSIEIPKSSPMHGFPLRYKLLSTYWEATNVVRREPEFMPSRGVLKTTDEAFGSHMTTKTGVRVSDTELCPR